MEEIDFSQIQTYEELQDYVFSMKTSYSELQNRYDFELAYENKFNPLFDWQTIDSQYVVKENMKLEEVSRMDHILPSEENNNSTNYQEENKEIIETIESVEKIKPTNTIVISLETFNFKIQLGLDKIFFRLERLEINKIHEVQLQEFIQKYRNDNRMTSKLNLILKGKSTSSRSHIDHDNSTISNNTKKDIRNYEHFENIDLELIITQPYFPFFNYENIHNKKFLEINFMLYMNGYISSITIINQSYAEKRGGLNTTPTYSTYSNTTPTYSTPDPVITTFFYYDQKFINTYTELISPLPVMTTCYSPNKFELISPLPVMTTCYTQESIHPYTIQDTLGQCRLELRLDDEILGDKLLGLFLQSALTIYDKVIFHLDKNTCEQKIYSMRWDNFITTLDENSYNVIFKHIKGKKNFLTDFLSRVIKYPKRDGRATEYNPP